MEENQVEKPENKKDDMIPFEDIIKEKQGEKTGASAVVDEAIKAATNAVIQNDKEVQKEVLDASKKALQNQTNAYKSRAEREEKEANFENKKSGCTCFGYNEKTTERWAVNVMAVWHNIMTAIWILVGMFTFAPIVYVAKKINVIIKQTWLTVLISLLIYFAVTTSPIWVPYIQGVIK